MRIYALICLLATGPAFAAELPKIAVVVDGPSPMYEQAIETLGQEVEALFADRFPGFRFPTEATHVGDFTLDGAKRILVGALADRKFDAVVGFGFFTGVAAAGMKEFPRPLLLPFATPELQGLPRDGAQSGRKNLTYLTGLIDLERELRRFKDVIRRDHDVLIIDRLFFDNIPNLNQVIKTRSNSAMRSKLVPVDDTAEKILAAIPDDTEAVYIGPLLRLPNSEVPALIAGLNRRRIPTYASEGRTWVERGAFTSLVPVDEDQRRLRRIAIYLQDALAGEDAGRFSTAFERRTQLVINMETARQIGVWPRFDLMTEAELIEDDPSGRGAAISLREAVELAVASNLNLDGSRKDVDLARQDYLSSLGFLYPEISVRGTADWIDPDVTSPFFTAERQLGYRVQGSQRLFAAGAVAGARSADATRRGVQATIDALELDTVASAATAYLNVLRARTGERINRENLQRVRANLALAEVRVEIGSAGRQEVFRWENEIADSRAQVIAASASRNQAEIALNRVVNRPLEQKFSTVEPLEDGVVFDEAVSRFVDDPFSFRVFRDFMVKEAQRNSPELRQLREAIAANEHAYRARVQRLWLPDISVNGNISHTPFRGGEGSEEIAGGAGIPTRVDQQWQVGALLNFPVFEYTRYPEIEKTKIALSQLQVQKAGFRQRVEQRVRSALHQAAATRAAVKLRRDAANAAEQNLALVTDAYRQGTVNVVTLIDAQNQALSANLAAANALYDFLVDFIEVERAAGNFGFQNTKDERTAFVARLHAFALEQGQEN